MSFKAYLDNIQTNAGKSPAEFKAAAETMGFTVKGKMKLAVKAGEIVQWLKDDFDLGNGHAMAIVALFRGKKV